MRETNIQRDGKKDVDREIHIVSKVPEGLKKDTRKIKYFLMKTLRTTRATTCRTFSIYNLSQNEE